MSFIDPFGDDCYDVWDASCSGGYVGAGSASWAASIGNSSIASNPNAQAYASYDSWIAAMWQYGTGTWTLPNGVGLSIGWNVQGGATWVNSEGDNESSTAAELGFPSLGSLGLNPDYSIGGGPSGSPSSGGGSGGGGATRVRTATCSLIGQVWRACGYSCTEPATGAVAVSWFGLSTIQKTPACSAYTSCPKYVFVEIIGHGASITGCSQSN